MIGGSAQDTEERDFAALISKLAALRRDRLRGRPSDRALAKAAEVSATTVGDWLRGRHFPKRIDPLMALLDAIRVQAARAGLRQEEAVATLLDPQRWREAYQAEARKRADGTRDAVTAEQARTALERLRPGRPLDHATDPFALEVHHAIEAPSVPGAVLPPLPWYVPREHDRVLADVVDQAAGGTSRIAVLVGGSSTGKTRACWEALEPLRRAAQGWRLWHPIDPTRPDALLAELREVGPRTVVWLNDAQFYLDHAALGERVAAGLRELLRDPHRAPVLVLATLWPPHWERLTTRPAKATDPHAHARELLGGRKIRVPEAFTGRDLDTLTVQAAGDPRLDEALTRSGDGQITQYLAGVPLLMDRYQDAPPATRALIHAAMDARRMGCGPRLPLALLAEAAPGYLTESQWEQTGPEWLDQALEYTGAPCYGIPGILTPVKNATPRNLRNRPNRRQRPSEPLYRLADYLDQHGLHHRAKYIPPIDFWSAAAEHAHPGDLTALGWEAECRGLLRDAAQLYKRASGHGAPLTAGYLLHIFRDTQQSDDRSVQWAVEHTASDDPEAVTCLLTMLPGHHADDQITSLLDQAADDVRIDDPAAVSQLLDMLVAIEARAQVTKLLERDPAAHAALDDPLSVALLLRNLRRAEADEISVKLAERAIAHGIPGNEEGSILLQVIAKGPLPKNQTATFESKHLSLFPLEDIYAVSTILEILLRRGAEEQVSELLDRNPGAHVPLDDPDAVGRLLEQLRKVEADDQFNILARRSADGVPLKEPNAVKRLHDRLRSLGVHEMAISLAQRIAIDSPLDEPEVVSDFVHSLREMDVHEQITTLTRRAAAQAPVTNPDAVRSLLNRMREVGAHEEFAILAQRAADCTPLDDSEAVGRLLKRLREVKADEQFTALAQRVVIHTPLDNPAAASALLDCLQWLDAHAQIRTLLNRDPATRAALGNPKAVKRLLCSLWNVGAQDQVTELADRAAACIPLGNPIEVAALLDGLKAVEAHEQIIKLLARAPVDHFEMADGPVMGRVAELAKQLQDIGASEQATALIERLPAAGVFRKYLEFTDHRERFRWGREPDGSPAVPWTWDDLD
ncbi:Obg family GTPase CgtA%2C C-terminal extension [Mycobacterium tuberculosis]|nr:Obg family GTPase CgtA%2C C-terminal extension [Mycobacterium tuberculosis]